MPVRSARPTRCSLLEVDKTLRLDERGHEVRRDDVDPQDVRAAVDAGVVDHCVRPPQLVDLVGDGPRLLHVAQFADDDGAAVDEAAHGRQPFAVAAWRMTSWPLASSDCAASRPRPSETGNE